MVVVLKERAGECGSRFGPDNLGRLAGANVKVELPHCLGDSMLQGATVRATLAVRRRHPRERSGLN